MYGALFIAASVSLSTGLGYEGVAPGGGLDLEVTSRSSRSQAVISARYADASKVDAGGYQLSGGLTLRRFFGHLATEAGVAVTDQHTSEWSKLGVRPFVGVGYKSGGLLSTAQYQFDDGTQNELHGVLLRTEYTEGLWRAYGSVGFWNFLDQQGAKQGGTSLALGVALRVLGH